MKKDILLPFLVATLTMSLVVIVLADSSFEREDKNKTAKACQPQDYLGEVKRGEKTAVFRGKEISVPSLALYDEGSSVLSVASEERWIEVDLSEQKLYAWEGEELFLESLISSGLPATPTPTGEFRVWIKLQASTMEGGEGGYYYYLPNVPFVMFFENEDVPGWKGYGLHGTYWHDDFGTQKSHGCVNLPTNVAKELFYWASPGITEGKGVVKSSNNNPGVRIVIHE